ncbi:MAG: sigma 54-interacting transcriptional regulator [Pseudomonadota bacterium]
MSDKRSPVVTSEDEPKFAEELFVKSFLEPLADLPIAIIAVNRVGSVSFLNAVAGYFLGTPTSIAIGKPIESIMPNSNISGDLENSVTVHDRQEFVNGRLLKYSLIHFSIKTNLPFALIVMQDVTERISLEKELAKARNKYEMLDMMLDESFEELGAVDKYGRLFYLTRKSAINLGIDRDEAVGQEVTILNPKCLLKKVAQTGIMEITEISRRNKKSVPVVVMPLIKDDLLQGAVCKSLFTDVQEAKRFVCRIQEMEGRRDPSDSPKKVFGCRYTFNDIMGTSNAIELTKKRAFRAAKGDSNVLITGESGTGKELFAQAIHMASPRRHGPFVAINCAGIPENLLESELFGYEFGSFTGARKGGKPGKFQMSHNGTIFLDEVPDMSVGMQAKLLRVIQEREFERVGGTQTFEVDVRIIAATNRDLWDMVQKGQFREDLYYRLDVVSVQTPPLRNRLEDIHLLTQFFISRIRGRIESNVTGITEEVLELFVSYEWPGNVRELRNVIEGAMNLNTGTLIDADSLPTRIKQKMMMIHQEKSIASSGPVYAFEDGALKEKAMIEHAMQEANSNKRKAATMLRMSRATLYNKLKKYGIELNR